MRRDATEGVDCGCSRLYMCRVREGRGVAMLTDQQAPTKQVLDLGETEVEEELFNDFLQCVHAGPSALACVDTYLTDAPPRCSHSSQSIFVLTLLA